jgi:hypothetical protein
VTRAGAGWWCLCVGLACACSAAPGKPAVVSAAPSLPVEFAYRTLDGRVLDSFHTRGRATALLFVTTFDWASQVEARRLAVVVTRYRPQAYAVAVVLESDQYKPLAEVFRSSLRLPFPVAMADEPTRLGEGPFGAVSTVPTLVVLDRAGREVWRKAGLCEAGEIEKALAEAARTGSMVP